MWIEPTPKDIERFWAKVDRGEPDECWEWQAGSYDKGYGRYGYRSGSVGAHVFSYAMANGPFENTPTQVVMHTCDNPPCVNPAHLRLGSQHQNLAPVIGKLDWAKVRAIRAEFAAGVSQKDLAHKYDTDQTNISRIVRNKTWKE